MRVIRADVMGTCFGVNDALEMIDAVERPAEVTIHGQLVHNELVQSRLEARGFVVALEGDRKNRLPTTPVVLITAHGVSDRERDRLQTAGKRIVDTTCPLVIRVHMAAQALCARGFHVLVIGKRGHVEVDGITEDLDHFDVIESEEEVRAYFQARLGIVCQTTMNEARVSTIRARIAAANPCAEIQFVDTICLPTKERQRALERLIGQVEAVVVVGGRHSNNTCELVERCRRSGRPVLHIQHAADLDSAWFQPFSTVGLTAGTSTLPETIHEVHRALISIGSHASRIDQSAPYQAFPHFRAREPDETTQS